MKVFRTAALVLAAALVLLSCQSMAQGAVNGALSSITGGSIGGGGSGGGSGGGAVASGASAALVDFQNGEVLATDAVAMVGERFSVARVLTQASAATKNQAEVIWVVNGQKKWVNYVVNSRKASKGDMVVGANVFVCEDWDDIDSEVYRKHDWSLLAITSVDQLYKGRVEVAGGSYKVDFIRIPTDPVK